MHRCCSKNTNWWKTAFKTMLHNMDVDSQIKVQRTLVFSHFISPWTRYLCFDEKSWAAVQRQQRREPPRAHSPLGRPRCPAGGGSGPRRPHGCAQRRLVSQQPQKHYPLFDFLPIRAKSPICLTGAGFGSCSECFPPLAGMAALPGPPQASATTDLTPAKKSSALC